MSDPPVDVLKPFSWDLLKLEQLGGLIEAEETCTYDYFHNDLRTAAAEVVAGTGNNDLVFLGRSPEERAKAMRSEIARKAAAKRWKK